MRLGETDLQAYHTQKSRTETTVYVHGCHIVDTPRSEDSRERDGNDNNGQLTSVEHNCSRVMIRRWTAKNTRYCQQPRLYR